MEYADVPAPESAYVVRASVGSSVAGDFVEKVILAESSGNPQARPCDPKTGRLLSSAFGAGQFVEATWLEMVRKHRPDLAEKSDEEILDLRADFALSREMTVRYAEQNRLYLINEGHQPTLAALYLAHFAGARGASNLLHAHRDSPVADILSPQAVEANPFLQDMTVASLYAWARAKMSIDPRPLASRVAQSASAKATPYEAITGCGPADAVEQDTDAGPVAAGEQVAAAMPPEPQTSVSRLRQTVRFILGGVVRFVTRS